MALSKPTITEDLNLAYDDLLQYIPFGVDNAELARTIAASIRHSKYLVDVSGRINKKRVNQMCSKLEAEGRIKTVMVMGTRRIYRPVNTTIKPLRMKTAEETALCPERPVLGYERRMSVPEKRFICWLRGIKNAKLEDTSDITNSELSVLCHLSPIFNVSSMRANEKKPLPEETMKIINLFLKHFEKKPSSFKEIDDYTDSLILRLRASMNVNINFANFKESLMNKNEEVIGEFILYKGESHIRAQPLKGGLDYMFKTEDDVWAKDRVADLEAKFALSLLDESNRTNPNFDLDPQPFEGSTEFEEYW